MDEATKAKRAAARAERVKDTKKAEGYEFYRGWNRLEAAANALAAEDVAASLYRRPYTEDEVNKRREQNGWLSARTERKVTDESFGGAIGLMLAGASIYRSEDATVCGDTYQINLEGRC